jgi:hypothetical protein
LLSLSADRHNRARQIFRAAPAAVNLPASAWCGASRCDERTIAAQIKSPLFNAPSGGTLKLPHGSPSEDSK